MDELAVLRKFRLDMRGERFRRAGLRPQPLRRELLTHVAVLDDVDDVRVQLGDGRG